MLLCKVLTISLQNFTAVKVLVAQWVGGNVFPQELCREILKLLSGVQELQRRSKADSSIALMCRAPRPGLAMIQPYRIILHLSNCL